MYLCIFIRIWNGNWMSTIGFCRTSIVRRYIKWELVKPGTRNEEMGNGKQRKRETGDEKWAFSFITACPLCVQQHLLQQTPATGDNHGEKVETIA